MIVHNKTVCVYDVEVFPNVFHLVIKNTELNKKLKCEISERRNDLDLIRRLFRVKDCLFCGYNSIHYDNILINYILDNYTALEKMSYEDVTYRLMQISNSIIADNFQDLLQYKYSKNFEYLDLMTMLFSKKLRVGLKELQVTMKFPNVQEYEGDFTKPLPKEEIDVMAEYNDNDVESTAKLLELCIKDIDLRLGIEKEYGINVLNKDGMNIGVDVIKHKYLELTGKTWDDIKDLRSPMDMIPLKDVILPFIKFDNPTLQSILDEAKQQVVSPGRKGYERHFLLDGVEHTLGVGGIHSVNNPELIIPAEDEYLEDIDVASLYPSLIISYEFYPPHLGKEFLQVYSKIKEERIEAKHNGDKVKNLTLKLALNGISGQLQNEYSWCYSPKTAMQIRMNGQFLLLMLAEKLVSAGCRIVQTNTDGIFYIGKKDREPEIREICRQWEQMTKLVLEGEKYEKMCQFAVNDYIAIGEGYSQSKDRKLIKTKGMFVNEVNLGKGMQPMIIPNAVIGFFADGIPPQNTVLNCRDINMFLTYQNVNKSFKVMYGDEIVTRINRFYYSTNGCYLYRYDPDTKKKTHLNKSSCVTIMNRIEDDFPDNINYRYYLHEINTIITKLTNNQCRLDLFD